MAGRECGNVAGVVAHEDAPCSAELGDDQAAAQAGRDLNAGIVYDLQVADVLVHMRSGMQLAFVDRSTFLRTTAFKYIADPEAVAKELAHARGERQADDDDRAYAFEELVQLSRSGGAPFNQGEQERRGGGDEFRALRGQRMKEGVGELGSHAPPEKGAAPAQARDRVRLVGRQTVPYRAHQQGGHPGPETRPSKAAHRGLYVCFLFLRAQPYEQRSTGSAAGAECDGALIGIGPTAARLYKVLL